MKLFKDEEAFIPRHKLRQICIAVSLLTLALYLVAMVFSLNGYNFFILNYQNTQMDNIETFLKEHRAYSLIAWAFSTLEFTITVSFITGKRCNLLYILAYYTIPVIMAIVFPGIPTIVYTFLTIGFYLLICALEAYYGSGNRIRYFRNLIINLLISQIVAYGLQFIIYIIKSGGITTENQIMALSIHFAYAIEYDIALSVILFTVSLCAYRGKGDSKQWATYHSQSGFSQTSKTRLQKSSSKNLSKKQKNKLFWLWVRIYVIQVLGFAFIMILPFLMGKVVEFLMMYLAFAIVRYILGFKYSLHFKNEILCITVGAVVFGILTLAVPFFYIELIIAVLLGSALAVFLYMSYKYKGFWLFAKMAKPDKFAVLYTIFGGDLSEAYIIRQCKYHGLNDEESRIVFEYMEGYKLSYLAHKFNYSVKTLDRKLTEAIEVLNNSIFL